MSDHVIEVLSDDHIQGLNTDFGTTLLRHDAIEGCFTIWGPVKICWKVEGVSVNVCLLLGSKEIACATIDENNPCAELEGDLMLVKASVKVCIENLCLTYDSRACARLTPFQSWECVKSNGTIVCL